MDKIFRSRQDIVNVNDPELLSIYDEMCRVAGNHPDHTHQPKTPYGTFHHPNFTFLSGGITRNTAIRLAEFNLPERLDDILFFDIGCNLGHVAIELARRGAKVKAFDCVVERLNVFKRLVKYLNCENSIEVHQVDFNNFDIQNFIDTYGVADNVICLAVDGYIKDTSKFYEFLHRITNEFCYIESNVKRDIAIELRRLFKDISSLGHSRTSGGGRLIYKAHNLQILFRKNAKSCIRSDGQMVQYFKFRCDYPIMKSLISRLNHPYIVPLKVQYNKLLMPYITNSSSLLTAQVSDEDKCIIKQQIIDVIKYLHTVGIAHRDFITQNILWLPDKKEIRLVDWEFIAEDISPIDKRYDLQVYTSNLLPGMHSNSIFSCGCDSGITVAHFLGGKICLSDFTN